MGEVDIAEKAQTSCTHIAAHGCVMIAMLVSAPALAAQDAAPTPEYTSWDDLSGATVGMVTGATFESALREKCPEVGGDGLC